MKRTLRHALALSLLSAIAHSASAATGDRIKEAATCHPQTPDTWASTCNNMSRRDGHSVTALAFGQTLVAGGVEYVYSLDEWGIRRFTAQAVASAEAFDEHLGQFLPAIGSLKIARYDHTAVRLASGKVLIVGGTGSANSAATSEIYHPLTQTFSMGPALLTARHYGHAATLLKDGRVLITGGVGACTSSGCTSMNSAEIYTPALGRFVPAGNMVLPRSAHRATLLGDGRVLITGGNVAAAEVFNPATGSFTAVGSMAQARSGHAAVLLADGPVLVVGGGSAAAERFNPSTNAFSPAGSLPPEAAYSVTSAGLLPSGKVAVVQDYQGYVYNPATATFSAGKSAFTTPWGGYRPSMGGKGALLGNGLFLWCGGTPFSQYPQTEGYAAVYRPE